ncbi:hypothetical protein DOT_2708 [Desulfosporosinus sp. OT]|nr:hypothetical protein DOT_2708 [Desulfosporosinus sp. OT]
MSGKNLNKNGELGFIELVIVDHRPDKRFHEITHNHYK